MGGRKKEPPSAADAIRDSVPRSIRSASATASSRTVSSRQNAREYGVGNRCSTIAPTIDPWALAGQ